MLRLTGGQFKGRGIATPHHLKTRPTQAKLRQALFNSLQTLIADAKVLDLFAGSGALGLEALSRGASHATFVEESRSAAKLIYKNISGLGVGEQANLITESVDRVWSRLKGLAPFDIVMADPPYEEGWEMKLLLETPWSEILAPDGVFCLEWGARKSRDVEELPEKLPFLVKVREKIYGDSVLTTYRREA